MTTDQSDKLLKKDSGLRDVAGAWRVVASFGNCCTNRGFSELRGADSMEFEMEDRGQQMGEDDASDIVVANPGRQRDRMRDVRRSQVMPKQDQAVFIPEQEPGSG